MNATRVSIIIPAFEAQATIGATLASVRAQTFRDWEIIVVDDGSRDGTTAIVQAAALEEPRIRLLPLTNGGVATARNSGIEAANGELLLFLDADDWIDSTHLVRNRPDFWQTEPPRLVRGEVVLVESTPMVKYVD